MIFTELRDSTAVGNRLTGLPHNEPAAREVSLDEDPESSDQCMSSPIWLEKSMPQKYEV